MLNLRINASTLTDGSISYAVRFEATNSDCTQTTVTIEASSMVAAQGIVDALDRFGWFAFTAPDLR